MTDAELEDLVRRFNACAVPRPEWTPAAHLTVGLWHVSRDKQTLLRFYSRPRLESSAARLDWVEPDLAPLP